jgi:hypothetical protein
MLKAYQRSAHTMLEDSWEDFEERWRRPTDDTAMLTQQTKGTASINAGAHAALALGESATVILRYDRQRNRIGLKAGHGEPHVYPLRRVGKSRTWVFSMIAFLHHHGLPVGQVRRYVGHLEGDTLVFDLNEGTASARGGKRHAKSA